MVMTADPPLLRVLGEIENVKLLLPPTIAAVTVREPLAPEPFAIV
jgi:hypothetical protein